MKSSDCNACLFLSLYQSVKIYTSFWIISSLVLNTYQLVEENQVIAIY